MHTISKVADISIFALEFNLRYASICQENTSYEKLCGKNSVPPFTGSRRNSEEKWPWQNPGASLLSALIVCLQASIGPINKARDGWAVKLYKLLISRETYTSGKPWRNRRKVILLPRQRSQPASVQVVTGVFNKVNFKTPARTEINFNAGYRLSPGSHWISHGARRKWLERTWELRNECWCGGKFSSKFVPRPRHPKTPREKRIERRCLEKRGCPDSFPLVTVLTPPQTFVMWSRTTSKKLLFPRSLHFTLWPGPDFTEITATELGHRHRPVEYFALAVNRFPLAIQ